MKIDVQHIGVIIDIDKFSYKNEYLWKENEGKVGFEDILYQHLGKIPDFCYPDVMDAGLCPVIRLYFYGTRPGWAVWQVQSAAQAAEREWEYMKKNGWIPDK